ncbi:RagB/SusD family nutrient uptake outer membrane protein [Autumnicola musiva]|uniref:RagB/SusD family nutrient uptake outer membrane protein n=1 Tax=Autumnicola musiva TaxID=3075589 RepID=A0ABU3DAK7_9FLAO|nr:RagB/SusD family nutrient uptake outer membrane protein [Zunongwangia sp. F117]MDT0678565.1 RagB/SusD family nutrient uptake outer membrane protein [Zunongwangia sp. F117]
MKTHQIIILLAAIISLNSCTKELELVDYGEINPAIFPQSAADVQAMVDASYYPLRASWWDGINTPSERGIMFANASTTEVLTGDFGVQLNASLLNFNPASTEITLFYDSYYNKISRMTTTIDYIQQADVSEEIKTKAIAEVRCARGMLAYYLYDMYGPIVIAPLEVLKNPLIEEPLARLSHDEMVNFIEADLQAAAEGLPTPQETEYGRFSKGLAKMLSIRLNLKEKRWDEVIKLSDEIIAMNYYELDPDYLSLWELDGARGSQEVIWAIPNDYEGTSENQWQMMALPSNYPGRGGWGTVQSTWWFYDTFEDEDVRKTNLIAEYTGTDGITYNRSNPGTNLNLGPLPLKMDPDVARTTMLSTVDLIQYRYADVLLSKAEAIANSSGPNEEAMELVNRIRRRAGLDDFELSNYSSLSDFNDMILTERSHEFWCENGQYRADLIRHNKLISRVIEVTQSPYATATDTVYPFSLERISEGKGEFIQNPGYN